MPQARPFPKSEQRKRLASKIELLGHPAMAPCPQCTKSGGFCVVKEGYARCSSCVKKNIQCSGTFSDAEFDSLESRKQELKRKSQEARAHLASLARQILAAQQVQESLDRQIEGITSRQSAMVDREARLLGELDHEDPGLQLAVMSDDFSLDDPSWAALLADPGGTGQRVAG